MSRVRMLVDQGSQLSIEGDRLGPDFYFKGEKWTPVSWDDDAGKHPASVKTDTIQDIAEDINVLFRKGIEAKARQISEVITESCSNGKKYKDELTAHLIVFASFIVSLAELKKEK